MNRITDQELANCLEQMEAMTPSKNTEWNWILLALKTTAQDLQDTRRDLKACRTEKDRAVDIVRGLLDDLRDARSALSSVMEDVKIIQTSLLAFLPPEPSQGKVAPV